MIFPEATGDWSRREFLRGGGVAAAMALMGGVELVAQEEGGGAPQSGSGGGDEPRLGCAVVGMGRWGREIVNTLARLPQAEVVAVCDTYPSSLRRGSRLAPEARQVAAPAELLEDPTIQAVIIATPTGDHCALAVKAMEAGLHVYCEAPLANRLEEAAAIAGAARAVAPRTVFRAGLQGRSDPLRALAAGFFRTGVVGKPVEGRAQWHRKQSWRQAASTPERKWEVNWRLDADRSLGLPGEVAIHHLDTASWLFGILPSAVSGYGSMRLWGEDGRGVADTVQLVVEYPDGVRLLDSCSLATSFGGELEVLSATDASVLMRDNRAWMFKELDAPLLGWEVHARKEALFDQEGLVLVANASKQKAAAEAGSADTPPPPAVSPLQHALKAFVETALDIEIAVEDFTTAYGDDDPAALREHLVSLPERPGAGWREGYEAVVMAAKAQEAVVSGRRIEFKPEWFELV